MITVQEGDSVSLTCLQTLPNNSVNEGPAKWTVHGSKPSNSLFKMHSLTANFEEEHLGTHFDGLNVSVATRTILTDPFERSDDPLRYTCLSDDVIGGATFVDVDVVYPPTFTIRRVPAFGVPVIVGMRISMVSCVKITAKTKVHFYMRISYDIIQCVFYRKLLRLQQKQRLISASDFHV